MDRTRATYKTMYIALGERIRNVRRKLPLTQEQLAASLGLSRTSITNIEGGRQPVLIHTLYAIAAELHVDVSVLLPDVGGSATKAAEHVQPPKNVSPKEWNYIESMVEPRATDKRRKTTPTDRKS